jgi:hypothetical protein
MRKASTCTPTCTPKKETVGALSSAGSERLPYKQEVTGSNPVAPTGNTRLHNHLWKWGLVIPGVFQTSRASPGPDNPTPTSLFYVMDTDSGSAWWASACWSDEPWIRSRIPEMALRWQEGTLIPVGSFTAPAEDVDVPGPEIDVLENPAEGSRRVIRLLLPRVSVPNFSRFDRRRVSRPFCWVWATGRRRSHPVGPGPWNIGGIQEGLRIQVNPPTATT